VISISQQAHFRAHVPQRAVHPILNTVLYLYLPFPFLEEWTPHKSILSLPPFPVLSPTRVGLRVRVRVRERLTDKEEEEGTEDMEGTDRTDLRGVVWDYEVME